MGKRYKKEHDEDCRRNSYRGIEPELVKTVRWMAAGAIGKAGFREHDLPDLEQELMLEALDKMPLHDPARGSRYTFVKVLLGSFLKRMYRNRHGPSRRTIHNLESLNQAIEFDDGDGGEMIELVNCDGLFEESNSQSAMQVFRDLSARLDIPRAIAALPDELQRLCAELQKCSIVEAARTLNMPPHKALLHIKAIRNAFKMRLGIFAD